MGKLIQARKGSWWRVLSYPPLLLAKPCSERMKLHIIGKVLGVLLGVPAVALGGSFATSLIQGQSPAEAVATIGNQFYSLLGRVSSIEAEQAAINERLDEVEIKQISQKPNAESEASPTSKEEPSIELKVFALDEETKTTCAKARLEVRPANHSLIGDIQTLCDSTEKKHETQEQFDHLVTSIKSKWELWIKTHSE